MAIKEIDFTKAIDKVVALKMKAVDKLIEDLVEPIADVGNPEKLIKKPYEEWTGQDFQLLSTIYGQSDDSPLANLVFRKEYEKLIKLEEVEGE